MTASERVVQLAWNADQRDMVVAKLESIVIPKAVDPHFSETERGAPGYRCRPANCFQGLHP